MNEWMTEWMNTTFFKICSNSTLGFLGLHFLYDEKLWILWNMCLKRREIINYHDEFEWVIPGTSSVSNFSEGYVFNLMLHAECP